MGWHIPIIRNVAAPTIIPLKFIFDRIFKMTNLRNNIDFTFWYLRFTIQGRQFTYILGLYRNLTGGNFVVG